MSWPYAVTPLLDDESFAHWLDECGIRHSAGVISRFPTLREIRCLLENLDGFCFEVSGVDTHWDADIFAYDQSGERWGGEIHQALRDEL